MVGEIPCVRQAHGEHPEIDDSGGRDRRVFPASLSQIGIRHDHDQPDREARPDGKVKEQWHVVLGVNAADGEDDEPTFETDPRSSDFLKIKIGETRLDPTAGLSSAIVLSARLLPDFLGGGKTKSSSGKFREFGEFQF